MIFRYIIIIYNYF